MDNDALPILQCDSLWQREQSDGFLHSLLSKDCKQYVYDVLWVGSKVECYVITFFWQLYCDQIEPCAEAREETCTCPWNDLAWGQQGHSLQLKPDWKFPEKRRGLSAAWNRSKPWSWNRNFLAIREDCEKFVLIQKPLCQWTEKQNRRIGPSLSQSLSGRSNLF